MPLVNTIFFCYLVGWLVWIDFLVFLLFFFVWFEVLNKFTCFIITFKATKFAGDESKPNYDIFLILFFVCKNHFCFYIINRVFQFSTLHLLLYLWIQNWKKNVGLQSICVIIEINNKWNLFIDDDGHFETELSWSVLFISEPKKMRMTHDYYRLMFT